VEIKVVILTLSLSKEEELPHFALAIAFTLAVFVPDR
jgi:hypothetical protein